MRYPQQLVEDAKMWDGEYDDVIGSRGDITRGIPADRKLEAFNRLLENADAFAEWVDAEFESP
ncbi:MAG: hypothetical protein FWG92_08015 [Leptospirales bacterium]|nr:hypothetical protein [Leptospirales bacterium]